MKGIVALVSRSSLSFFPIPFAREMTPHTQQWHCLLYHADTFNLVDVDDVLSMARRLGYSITLNTIILEGESHETRAI